MTQISGFIGAIVTVTLFVMAAFYKQNARISLNEAHAKVCDQKHKEHDLKFEKQDDINLKSEDRHIELVTMIAVIGNDVKHLTKKLDV